MHFESWTVSTMSTTNN